MTSLRTVLFLVSFSSALAACPSSQVPDGSADAADLASDVVATDTRADGEMDANADSAMDATGDTTIDSPPADVTPMDASASFVAMLAPASAGQNCMPVVASDPVTVSGTITVVNTGAIPIGPITIDAGRIVQLAGDTPIASFSVTPITLPVIQPGNNAMAMFTKTAGSLANDAGAMGCNVVMCGAAIRVQLALSGANVPVGTMASSAPMSMSCVF